VSKKGYVMPNLTVVNATTLLLEARSTQVIEVLAYCVAWRKKEVIRESLFLGMPSNQRGAGAAPRNVPENSRSRAHIGKSRPYQLLTKQWEI
jgi:hypothetical protein